MTREQVIQIAQAEVGTSESPANSNKQKYGEWYGMNGVAWCAIFVSWVFDKAGLPLGLIQTQKGYHHCQGAHNWFRRENRLTTQPQKGDIVMFDWQGDGWADHTGIFVEWLDPAKTKFSSLEGNTSLSDNSNGGQVMLRERRVESVKSFASPSVYSAVIEEPTTTLRVGDRGSEIVEVQKMLNDIGYPTVADGWYGNLTAASVRAFQEDNLMPVTGEVDEVCLGAIQEEYQRKIARSRLVTGTYLRFGDAGLAVLELQKALNENGANPPLIEDGDFGRKTSIALRAFQEANNLTVDGIAGPQTFEALGMI